MLRREVGGLASCAVAYLSTDELTIMFELDVLFISSAGCYGERLVAWCGVQSLAAVCVKHESNPAHIASGDYTLGLATDLSQ